MIKNKYLCDDPYWIQCRHTLYTQTFESFKLQKEKYEGFKKKR